MNLRLAISLATVVLATEPVAAQQPAILAPDASPGLLQERGAGEGPAWHPTLGLLTSGDGDIVRRDPRRRGLGLPQGRRLQRPDVRPPGAAGDLRGRATAGSPGSRTTAA